MQNFQDTFERRRQSLNKDFSFCMTASLMTTLFTEEGSC